MRMTHTHCTYIQMFAFSLNTLFSYFLSVNNIHSCYIVFLFRMLKLDFYDPRPSGILKVSVVLKCPEQVLSRVLNLK